MTIILIYYEQLCYVILRLPVNIVYMYVLTHFDYSYTCIKTQGMKKKKNSLDEGVCEQHVHCFAVSLVT